MKMVRNLNLAMTLACATVNASEAGAAERGIFDSRADGVNKAYGVYLPEGDKAFYGNLD